VNINLLNFNYHRCRPVRIYLIVNVNHPYVDEIRFDVSDTIEIATIAQREPAPEENLEYREAMALAEEMKAALTSPAPAEPKSIKKAVVCPFCGATTTPDEKGCCEYCGAPVPTE